MDQKSDPELVKPAKEVVTDKEMDTTSDYCFTYAVWHSYEEMETERCTRCEKILQIVVPKKKCGELLCMAHKMALACHLGIKKTNQ